MLLINQNNVHIGKLAKSRFPQVIWNCYASEKSQNRGKTTTAGRQINGGSCVKRKKENDIERVTGRNRPQKKVKSRALVRRVGSLGCSREQKNARKACWGNCMGQDSTVGSSGRSRAKAPDKLPCLGSFEVWGILGTTEFGTGCPRAADFA